MSRSSTVSYARTASDSFGAALVRVVAGPLRLESMCAVIADLSFISDTPSVSFDTTLDPRL